MPARGDQGQASGPQDVDVDHHRVDPRQGQCEFDDRRIKAVHTQVSKEASRAKLLQPAQEVRRQLFDGRSMQMHQGKTFQLQAAAAALQAGLDP